MMARAMPLSFLHIKPPASHVLGVVGKCSSKETQPCFIPKVLKAYGTLVIERLPLVFEGSLVSFSHKGFRKIPKRIQSTRVHLLPPGYTYAYGHIAYIHGRPPAPVILVHPNYAGCPAAAIAGVME